MNKIERLLHTLAPKGVGFRKLGEVCEILDNRRIPIAKNKRNPGIYPYYGANGIQDYIDSYIFDGDFVLVGEDGSVINKDNTPVVNWASGKIWVNNHAHVLQTKNELKLKFLYFYLQTIDVSYYVAGTPPKINQENLKKITIPIPPLEIQQEIVTILDAFTELNAELNARKKQYEYYQNMLLDFNDINQNHKDAKEKLAQKTYPKRLKQLLHTLAPKGVGFRKLGDIGVYIRGVTYKKNQEINNLECGIKVLRANNITLSNHLNFEDIKVINKNVKIRKEQYLKKNDILICAGSGSSEHIGKVAFIDTDFDYVFGGFMGVIRIREVNSRFVYYIFTSNIFKQYLEKSLNTTTINNLNANILQNFLIPIPPLEIQQEIVKILDQFSALTTDLQAGIPAEIKARKKQYEYYREKLLAFKPLTPNKEGEKG
ncbi:type I restriction modification DNA specificity domain protein [Helicobacter pylori GAM83Bi]|uniref:restriction endonuclease subunit S n=1 Tax=Helicobacter pylori TaxID=210 RepID=UPI0002B98C17|nr:restriction endonuclease subunit S [Helicobacter pylori]EMH36941.1 type I restriction modification DNA specificity domain protein [Helicobacter pylori GAM83Bi]